MTDRTQAPRTRRDYPHFLAIATRWMDNDIYGHVNNVVYYSYFDSVIGRYLVGEGGLDIHGGPVIGICAESACRYFAPIAFPETIEAGLIPTNSDKGPFDRRAFTHWQGAGCAVVRAPQAARNAASG